MTAPIAVDPPDLAATGRTVGGDGDAIATTIGSLDSGLSGAAAMFGHDAAGLVFAQSYTTSGKALLDAAAAAVNACRRVGFGVQVSAANYGHANASSTVGSGTSAVPVPTAPGLFTAPGMPPPLGDGIAAPMGWVLVEAFVGDVWPDGNPGELRAAAGAWRSFSTKISALAGQVDATGPGLGAQRIPEAGQMVKAVAQISGGLTDIAVQAQTLATDVDGFAGAVDATQNAVRSLLQQLSLSGVAETIGGIFTGHNPIDKVREVAHEIKTVLDNMKREADASSQIFSQGINLLDSATNSLETWASKEFTDTFGQEVGGALSFGFNAMVDQPEGALKFVAETVQGIQQLDPTRFAYDPSGAAKTWGGMLESTAVLANPALLTSKIAADPQGSLDTVKALVDWKDVEAGHPFRAVGYDGAQIASAFIPGVGEAEPAVIAGGVEGRAAVAGAGAEERLAAGASRDAVPGLTRVAAGSENIASEAGRLSHDLDAIKVPESASPGAAHGASAPTERPPVDTVPTPADSPSGLASVDTAHPVQAPRPETPGAGVPGGIPSPGPHEPKPLSLSPDSTPPVTPQEGEPTPARTEAPPPPSSHMSGPAQIADSDPARPPPNGESSESVPAAGESSRPESPASAPRATFEQPGANGDTRPVWANHEYGTGHDAVHDANASHDPDGHDAGSVDGLGPDGRVKFSGHGSYNPVDGETVIPEGSSVTVYAEHGSTITDGLGNLIETGGDTSHVYSRTYHAGEAMPNYTLHPPDGLDIQGAPWTVDASTRLSEMLEANMGEIDFAACLYDPGSPTNLVYDSHGIWDETQGQLTHVYGSPALEGSWEGNVSENEVFDHANESQPYYDADQTIYTQAPSWDYGDIDYDEF